MIDIFPSWFGRPRIKLTIDEIVSKFAQECDKEHHEVETFINVLLLKEQNNMIRELTIEVHQLSKVIKGVLFQRYDLNEITTRGGLVSKMFQLVDIIFDYLTMELRKRWRLMISSMRNKELNVSLT